MPGTGAKTPGFNTPGMTMTPAFTQASCTANGGEAGLAAMIKNSLSSNPMFSSMNMDGGAIARCICSDSFSDTLVAQIQNSATSSQAKAQAMRTMCSADCKGYLSMVYGAIGSMLSQMSQMSPGSDSSAPPNLSTIMGDMPNCMCDQPDFTKFLSMGESS